VFKETNKRSIICPVVMHNDITHVFSSTLTVTCICWLTAGRYFGTIASQISRNRLHSGSTRFWRYYI